jgi:hypothetical protein
MNKTMTAMVLVFALFTLKAYSQSKETSEIEGNLYAKTLSACLVKEANEYGNLGTNRVDYENRIVERNIHLTDKLPMRFGKTKVEYLDVDALRERYEKTRKEIQVLSLRPMKNEGATLIISIGNYWFSYKKKSYNYGLEGGCTVNFNFDSQSQSFILTKIDLWGI